MIARYLRNALIVLSLCTCLHASGCRAWDLYRDDAFDGRDNDLGSGLRPASSSSEGSWFSNPQSRSISRNLGW